MNIRSVLGVFKRINRVREGDLFLFSYHHCCLLVLLVGTFFPAVVLGQPAPGKYWIPFTDKDSSPYSINQPLQYLSQRSIDRRIRQGILVVISDLPVNPAYVAGVAATGASILASSKWMNSLLVRIEDTADLAQIQALPYVKDVKFVGVNSKGKSEGERDKDPLKFGIIDQGRNNLPDAYNDELLKTSSGYDYGPALNQIRMIKADVLHARGYRGQDMVIAVLDAGFYKADVLPVFDSLWAMGKVLGTRDFVEPGGNVFEKSSHGMMVLSTMAGLIPGEIIGTAPEAFYWLLRSEDANTEYPVEEDYWVTAAEFADSVGADIINSSLGYTIFDDNGLNHTYAEMDGNTAHSTIGADFAASKGMLVVSSAGNSGGSFWQFVGAPADADSILTVGAVNPSGHYADFSSTGPTSDGRIKPDVVTQGEGTFVYSSYGGVFPGNGTSFASPVMAGAASCLWQAHPEAKNSDIYQAVIESASQYQTPDNELGYGIPDLVKADMILDQQQGLLPDERVYVFPNPSFDQVTIHFYLEKYGQVKIELFDYSGRTVMSSKLIEGYPGENICQLSESGRLCSGIYVLRFYTSADFSLFRWLKL